MAAKTQGSTRKKRADGRRPLLVHMDVKLIKALKKAALDDECNAYDIVETATRGWLDKRREARAGKRGTQNDA